MTENTVTEVPDGCTCTWALRLDDRHWERIGAPKEDCPQCTGATPRPPRRDPHEYPPEWLDDNRGP